MTVAELLEYINDYTNVNVVLYGKVISRYDGRDSIPTEHNKLKVSDNGIYVKDNELFINVMEEM